MQIYVKYREPDVARTAENWKKIKQIIDTNIKCGHVVASRKKSEKKERKSREQRDAPGIRKTFGTRLSQLWCLAKDGDETAAGDLYLELQIKY